MLRLYRMQSNLLFALSVFLSGLGLFYTDVALAEEPTFRIEFRDGVTLPNRIDVPANTRIRLELVNLGETPAEFESQELRKEKVLAPHTVSIMVIHSLTPGEYAFFDDFHPGAPAAALIAK